jgi:hypothetical protein
MGWFVGKLLGSGNGLVACIDARRSVTQSTEKSDLEVDLVDVDASVTRLLIENKINAGLQPQQAHRYRQRGDGYLRNQDCEAFITIIAAPSHYFGNDTSAKGFDLRCHYEDLLAWFQGAQHLGPRHHHKTSLLQSAIEKGTLGYQRVEDAASTEFWRLYWEAARVTAPRLELKKSGGKPSRASFAHYRPTDLPPQTKIVHKLRRSGVDLQLAGLGRRVNEVHRTLGGFLEADMVIERASESAVVRIRVPKVEPQMPFAPQRSAVLPGIEAARRLHDWCLKHADAVNELRQ